MPYLLLKWLHVLAAIVAVGSNVTYGIWIARASRSPEALPFTLRGIKLIDDRVANPAYGLLLATALLHLPRVAAGAGGRAPAPPRRARRAGGHAHRLRQIAHLPTCGPASPRHHARHLAA